MAMLIKQLSHNPKFECLNLAGTGTGENYETEKSLIN
jgi:hypothetical protein